MKQWGNDVIIIFFLYTIPQNHFFFSWDITILADEVLEVSLMLTFFPCDGQEWTLR